MKKHVKNYMKYYDYAQDDIILCEVCFSQAVDLHHIIYKSQGGSDNVDNIIALCRTCHEQAHSNELSVDYLQAIHKTNLNK